ncbi:MAG: hydroxyacylglutathione hydrolase [Acaryochloridaceae cyanobacterium SU_2_1]|nr:hydroxyacylglutathione hydrolase [Acaryochloridaceae cyanobacterium SU_2_1]
MEIYQLPAFADNYLYILQDLERKIAAVVDPGDPIPVLQKLRELDTPLVAIFNTHHHSDHIGGNRQLLQHFPQAVVYGGAGDRGRIPGQQVFLQDGDRLEFGDRKAEVLFVPGHTLGHIAYFFTPLAPDRGGELFCGDTLFAGGCGRLFEGSPSQMLNSLDKLRQLPEATRVWCAHEYTLSNLQFALTLEPQNQALQNRYAQVKAARLRSQPTVPSDIGIEKTTNPFFRWDQPALMALTQNQDPVKSFAKLRRMKDQF